MQRKNNTLYAYMPVKIKVLIVFNRSFRIACCLVKMPVKLILFLMSFLAYPAFKISKFEIEFRNFLISFIENDLSIATSIRRIFKTVYVFKGFSMVYIGDNDFYGFKDSYMIQRIVKKAIEDLERKGLE